MGSGVAALLALLVASAGCGSSCRGESSPRAGGHEPAEVPRDRVARVRGETMVSRAAECEQLVATAGAGDARLAEPPPPCVEACELGHSNSCALLGEHHRSAGDAAEARRAFDRACRGGSGIGCEGAAALAEDDGARDRLLAEARRYHRVHCEQGYRRSCRDLAAMFDEGRGGPASTATADHFRRLAERP